MFSKYYYVLIGLTQQSTRCSGGSCQTHEDLIAGFSAIESVAVAFDFCTRCNGFVYDLLKRAAGDIFNNLHPREQSRAIFRAKDSYGYQIIKDMKPYLVLSESTLYTILKRLEAANMLTVRTAEHGGRLRKYYRITEAGLKRIEEFKAEWEEILSIYRFVTKEDDGNE